MLDHESNNIDIILAERLPMDRFLIESPHTVEECKRAIKMVFTMGYLNNFDWGCTAGVHEGWVIIEADNQSEALLVVPPFLRSRARAVKLARFDPEKVKDFQG